MHLELCEELIQALKSAAKKLAGFQRRQFQAEVAWKYCDASARKTERAFGWGQRAVETGLNAQRNGICCLDNFWGRGPAKPLGPSPPARHVCSAGMCRSNQLSN